MRILVFSRRNLRELVRDKLNLIFGLGFPIILLLLLTAIQRNIPVSMFELDQLTPGIAVFGLSFISLFSASLIAKDRGSSFLMRMFTSPLQPAEFILGYTLPLLPLAVAQTCICYLCAICLGLTPTWTIFAAILASIPAALVFIGLGLLCGTLLTERQVGGICGALLTNLSAWLSGTWFSLDLVGGAFKTIAMALPFAPAVNAGRAALAGDWAAVMPPLWLVIGYAAVICAAAIFFFRRKAKE